MSTKKINGIHLEKMMKNGLSNLSLHIDEINRLNVFPVPDGDTGTNMFLTLENGVNFAKSSEEAGTYLRTLSDGMLLGARGNSGVILSQFFKGFATALAKCTWIGPGELRNGLIRGYQTAYESVVHPVEGTILSVTREGIELIRSSITRYSSIENILSMYIAQMKKTLSYTPEMLAVLKEAGVVDSGAAGFILIAEGMLKCLYGDMIEQKTILKPAQKTPMLNLSMFNENSEFSDGYCTEFILQRMNSPKYKQNFSKQKFINALKTFGDSLVVVEDNKRVKVHIHTLVPSRVIAYAQQYGEFLTFKMDNMQVQHNERDRVVENTHKPLSIVAVVNGEGMAQLFKNLGADIVLDGGATTNTSSQEFVDAIKSLDADHVVILPDNPNVILAAEQAVKLSGSDNVTVLPTKSFAEGYFAIAMDVPDSSDVDYRISQMRAGVENITTISQTVASRDYSYHEISCKKGDEIALLDGEIVCVNDNFIKSITDALQIIEDIDDKETCVIFRGKNTTEDDAYELSDAICAVCPMMDIEIIDAQQEIYHWILGIS